MWRCFVLITGYANIQSDSENTKTFNQHCVNNLDTSFSEQDKKLYNLNSLNDNPCNLAVALLTGAGSGAGSGAAVGAGVALKVATTKALITSAGIGLGAGAVAIGGLAFLICNDANNDIKGATIRTEKSGGSFASYILVSSFNFRNYFITIFFYNNYFFSFRIKDVVILLLNTLRNAYQLMMIF